MNIQQFLGACVFFLVLLKMSAPMSCDRLMMRLSSYCSFSFHFAINVSLSIRSQWIYMIFDGIKSKYISPIHSSHSRQMMLDPSLFGVAVPVILCAHSNQWLDILLHRTNRTNGTNHFHVHFSVVSFCCRSYCVCGRVWMSEWVSCYRSLTLHYSIDTRFDGA